MEVLAIIPARSGSKSVKDKNIRIMNGKPMLAYSIEHAKQSQAITRTIVTTDSEEYAKIARQYGAETPFLRPKEISADHSLDLEVFEHALQTLNQSEGYLPDFVVQLRPTYPIRNPKDIDRMITMLEQHPQADSVRSIAPAYETPYKMWRMEQERIRPVLDDIPEAYNQPRQSLPKIYTQNACIDVIRTQVILADHSMSGNTILGYPMTHNFDIDTEADFIRAEQYLLVMEKIRNGEKLGICCDIDGVIASKNPDNDYSSAQPIWENIHLLQNLAAQGHQIDLYTARGCATGIDWKEETEKQMKIWGVPFHRLAFGKPDADLYLDDKLADFELLNLLNQSF